MTTAENHPAANETPVEARQRHAELSEQLTDASLPLLRADAPTLSDADYDRLMRELEALEDEFPELRTPDSPTQQVGGRLSPPQFTPVDHLERMLCLDNAFSAEELRRLGRRGCEREIDRRRAYLCELKVDGLAIDLVYEQRPADPRRHPGRRPDR